jgi:hypothetical protein
MMRMSETDRCWSECLVQEDRKERWTHEIGAQDAHGADTDAGLGGAVGGTDACEDDGGSAPLQQQEMDGM